MIDSLEADIKQAQKSGDRLKTDVLKGIKNALHNERIKLGHDLSQPEIAAVLKREAKQRDEAAAVYQRGGADERAQKEQAEKAIIEQYLPAMMPMDELEALADEIIAEVGKDPQQIGAIIGQIMARSQGQADGRQAAEVVKRKLA